MPENVDQNNSEYGHFLRRLLWEDGKCFSFLRHLKLLWKNNANSTILDFVSPSLKDSWNYISDLKIIIDSIKGYGTC